MTVTYNPALHVPDVNHWEGIPDHFAMHSAGVRRCITKLTEGRNFGDPLAGYAFLNWRRLGIEREAYHFLTSWDDPVEQLMVFHAALQGVQWFPTEPIWLDLETRGISLAWRALGTAGLRRKARPFILASVRFCIQKLGVIPGIYTRMELWNRIVGTIIWENEGLPVPPLWTADYGYNGEGSGIKGPRWIDSRTWPRGWSRWQFTDRGRLPGVPGSCDLNIERDGP
jgi:lysozyme